MAHIAFGGEIISKADASIAYNIISRNAIKPMQLVFPADIASIAKLITVVVYDTCSPTPSNTIYSPYIYLLYKDIDTSDIKNACCVENKMIGWSLPDRDVMIPGSVPHMVVVETFSQEHLLESTPIRSRNNFPLKKLVHENKFTMIARNKFLVSPAIEEPPSIQHYVSPFDEPYIAPAPAAPVANPSCFKSPFG